MSEDNFRKFIESTEKEKKDFLICGDENDKGECCLWEKGHKGEHEYHSAEEIHAEAKIINDRANPDVDDYIKEKLTGETEPEDGFIKIDPHNSFKDKPDQTNLDLKHNKKELAIAIGILSLAIGIGIFLIFDNIDYVQSLIDNPPPFANIFDPIKIAREIQKDDNPVERIPRQINPQQQNDQTPLPIDPTVTTDEFSQLLSYNAFIVYSDGDWKATYLDGENIPIDYFGNGYNIISFDCWKDFNNEKHFFGVFQIIKGTTLEVHMNIVGAYPSFPIEIGQGESITFEGICP